MVSFRQQILLSVGVLAGYSFAQKDHFEMIRISDKYYAEAAYAADINKDGNVDVLSGSMWWAGPGFTTGNSFYNQGPYTGQYSSCWRIYAFDVNGDGSNDPIVIKGPGNDAHWYQNTGSTGNFSGHRISGGNQNESPMMFDIDGDGKVELLTGQSTRIGYYKQPSNPTQAWTFYQVSVNGFTETNLHGIGGGDVNGDGRADILQKEGWWEQPANVSATTPWVHHEHKFYAPDLVREKTGGADMYAYDVDGDGDNDVITGLQAHGRGIGWFENVDGKGEEFKMHIILPPHSNSNGVADTVGYGVSLLAPHALAMADMNGDGLMDLVAGSRYWTHHIPIQEGTGDPLVWWFELTRGPNGVKYIPHEISDVASVGTGLHVTDVNKDGMPDVVVAEPKGVYLFINKYTKPLALRPPQEDRTMKQLQPSEFHLQWRAPGVRIMTSKGPVDLNNRRVK
jgi:hypothetical protein